MAMPETAQRKELAKLLRIALAEQTDRAIREAGKYNIMCVLVAWHDKESIPYIEEAQKKGYLGESEAYKAIKELEKEPSA